MSNSEGGKSYCCIRKCFVHIGDCVDGIACDKCGYFSFCHCKCETVRSQKQQKTVKGSLKCSIL